MIKQLTKYMMTATLPVLGVQYAEAHLSYNGRDFTTFQPDVVAKSVTIGNQTVTGSYGWADGTDADFGDSHKMRIFRFTLANAGYVTITSTASTNGGTRLGGLLPAFSLYSGLAHIPPSALDHDFSNISNSYLLTQGVGKEGIFVAMGDWKIGNDTSIEISPGVYDFNELSSFTYIGNAADGTSANYGSASGINGDGLADGTVTSTFYVPAGGDYSLLVGGALYSGQLPTPDAGVYGITTTISVIPEPSATLLLGITGLGLILRRRRI